MKDRIRLIILLVALGCGAALFAPARPAQQPSASASTSAAQATDAAACAPCHGDIVAKQTKTAMARAMEKTAECRILRSHPSLKMQQGKFTYRIERQGEQSIYTVTDGQTEIAVPILYGFGQGKSGQTYVFSYNGAFYESRVSFYRAIDGLDLTLGYADEAPASVAEAIGRRLSVDESRRCFNCHNTGALQNKQLETEHLRPGLSCETCHGSPETHLAALRAGEKTPAKSLRKLTALDGDDLTQNVCGRCHRSADDVMEMPNQAGLSNIRFQPYRMFNSRCYSADRRIGCTACHDPHDNVETSPAFYDAKCLACHQRSDPKARAAVSAEAAKSCPKGTRDCVSCHMPKVALAGAHFQFTDHRIRIVRPGAPYPK